MRFKLFHEIENNYDVNSITVNGMQVWPILRMEYFYAIRLIENSLNNNSRGIQKPTINDIKNIVLKIINIVNDFRVAGYNITSWLRKYDYIVFSSSEIRCKLDNKYWDKLFDYVIQKLGNSKTLDIEIPRPVHLDKKKIITQNVTSYALINLAVAILSKIYCPKMEFKNKSILNAIENKLKVTVNYKKIIHLNLISIYIHSLLFKLYKPRIVFIQNYCGNFGAIKASRDLKIPVVEMQHGIIGKYHPAYNIPFTVSSSFFPDYFLTFGDFDKEVLSTSYFINNEKVIPVGNFYLNYIKKRYTGNKGVKEYIDKFKISIAVTLQFIVEKELLDFIITTAGIDDSICFIIIPRSKKKKDFKNYNFPGNITFFDDLRFYEIVPHCTYHTTVGSTCALESIYLGIRNILVDIRGFARYYYEYCTTEETTVFVDTPKEYLSKAYERQTYSPESVMKEGAYFYNNRYTENVDTALTQILGKNNY